MASDQEGFSLTTEKVGEFNVTIQEKGEYKKIGALLTIHDIGLNKKSFQDFFNNEHNLQMLNKFKIYHVEIPGQHSDAEALPSDYDFPTLPKMADNLVTVLDHFKLNDVIGLGVGAGAVILLHLAMIAPERFLGITVIDPAGKSVGFKEWGEEKMAIYSLEKKGFTSTSDKFLIWHLFGSKGKQKANTKIVEDCLKDIKANQNPYNLSLYVKAHMNRTDMINDVQQKLKCHVLVITSTHSPYKDESYTLMSKLNRSKSSILESLDTINAFFEDPGKCGEGMLLMMQGCGLVPTLRARTASMSGPPTRVTMNEDKLKRQSSGI